MQTKESYQLTVTFHSFTDAWRYLLTIGLFVMMTAVIIGG